MMMVGDVGLVTSLPHTHRHKHTTRGSIFNCFLVDDLVVVSREIIGDSSIKRENSHDIIPGCNDVTEFLGLAHH